MTDEKAQIVSKDKKIKVQCLFNPTEYSIGRSNKWDVKLAKGENIPKVSFTGGEPASLTMKLLFDTFEKGTDVRQETKGLWEMMRIDTSGTNSSTSKGEPPKVIFQWGKLWSFEAVIEKISQKFNLFMSDGTPVRSTVDVTFKQVQDEMKFAGTNPTSGGGEPQRVHVVQAGDRLDLIAYQEYGDPSMWRLIADANNLIRPRHLRPGQKLVIPAA